MPNYSQIFGSVVCSDAGMVFIEGYIQAIMETILKSLFNIFCKSA